MLLRTIRGLTIPTPPHIVLIGPHICPRMRKDTIPPKFRLRNPAAQPNQSPDHGKNNTYPHGNPKDIRRDQGTLQSRVEERVCIKALGSMREIG